MHNDLDIVLLLKTMHKMKACISALMIDKDDIIEDAKKIYARQIIVNYGDLVDDTMSNKSRSKSVTEE